MLDAQFIRDNLETVKANCLNRNVKADVDRVVALDDERRRVVQEKQLMEQKQNELSKLIPKEKDPAKKQSLIQDGRMLREKVGGFESSLKILESELQTAL